MCKDDQNQRPNPTSHQAESHPKGLAHGWVIEGFRDDDGQSTGRFLQIGTGQWCPCEYATVFPLKETAMVYAHEFGYSIGRNARIVRFRRLE